MLRALKNGIRAWREVSRFRGLSEEHRSIVFYSEGGGYWPYLGPLVEELAGRHGRSVAYATSDPDDPVLASPPDNVTPLYVGGGSGQIAFFMHLKAGVLVTTMPDLETFHIKRSKGVGTYAYVHHSLVSTHMVYRPEAFDHFDAILCAGPHHETETRDWEAARNLPAKRLLAHGYGPLDALMKRAEQAPPLSGRPSVLVAPSWGEHGLLETRGVDLCRALLDADMDVVVRPHPRTASLCPSAIKDLEDAFSGHPGFSFDATGNSKDSFLAAHLLVTDWSGTAFEYAFGLLRPVLFVDINRKVNNPDYQQIDLEPIEVFARELLGKVVAADSMPETARQARALMDSADEYAKSLRAERDRWVYNPGHSAEAGARAILELVEKPSG